MKILSVDIKNILGVEEATIEPDGNIIEITGKNGSGKTSRVKALLDVIGVDTCSELIRKGEKSGKTVIELDGMRLTKTYTEKNPKGTLKVEGQVVGTDSYSKISSPSAVLKGLVNPNSVDPIRLLTASDKELVGAVLESLPMKTDTKYMNELTGQDFSENVHALVSISDATKFIVLNRRDINRDLKTATTTMEQLKDTLPKTIESTEDIEEEIQEQQDCLENLMEDAKGLRKEVHDNRQIYVDTAMCAMEKASEELEKAQAVFSDAKAEHSKQVEIQITSANNAFESKLGMSQEINENISELQKGLSEVGIVEKTAERVTEYKLDIRKLSRRSKTFDKQLVSLEKYKAELCSDLPIEGLELEDGKLQMNGIPFATLNTAARVDLVIELAKLGAGKLGLVVLDNSEMLDSGTYKEFLKKARKTDLQFICARVTDNDLEVKS